MNNQMVQCCAECGEDGGVSLKACKSYMSVNYCNSSCQRNHWLTHKKDCKQRAAELRNEALFKDPPAKEDCPICFLPMPVKLISCASLPPATVSSVPIHDFAIANEGLATKHTDQYYPCCGTSICKGCVVSFYETWSKDKCPFCNAEISLDRPDEEKIADVIKRVEANDPGAINELACYYVCGRGGVQQDHAKSTELHVKAAELGSSMAYIT